jgi:hypothetical protein
MSSCRLLVSLLVVGIAGQSVPAPQPRTAGIEIDASSVEGRISPHLYGQFLEFMFEGIKYGLHAELIRDRGFEDQPGPAGLSRSWERYPDDRNDDYGISFGRDEEVAYPTTQPAKEPQAGTRSASSSARESSHVMGSPRRACRCGRVSTIAATSG